MKTEATLTFLPSLPSPSPYFCLQYFLFTASIWFDSKKTQNPNALVK